jgi:uncharacterized membrane protein
VVGYAPSNPAFRWTRAGGYVSLPEYMSSTDCGVNGISANGVYSVGTCMGQTVPVRWMGTNAPVNMGLPASFTSGGIYAASADGSAMTGYIISGGNTYAGLWRSGSNPAFIGAAAGVDSSYANSISGDGSVIVGDAHVTTPDMHQAFRWTQAGGMVLIPPLPGGLYGGAALDVSADGTKVVGTSNSGPPESGDHAFLWNSSTGTIIKLNYPGDGYSYGRAISGDGTVTAGTGFSGVWLSINGATPVPLGATLAGLGIDLAGFALNDVADLSANGKVIIGVGFQTVGGTADEGWIAVLP